MKKQYFFTEKMCVGYDEKAIVKDIEIMVQEGEILTLIGPNGAGKSTVLKSIAGQIDLLGGTAYLDGESLAEIGREERAKKMSVVFTERLQTELMTCRDVVATGRYPYTGRFGILSKNDHHMVDEAMEWVHITDMKDADFRKISDGQRQRVMLARAICQETDILILDEPVSYLDIKHKLEFLFVLQELCEQRRLTVIMSLHELDLAKIVSDKILCLKGEYIFRYGTPEDVFKTGLIEQLFEIDEADFSSNKKFLAYLRQIGG